VCARPRAANAMLLSRLGFGGGSKAAPAYNRQSRPGAYLVELAAYVRRHENALLQAAIKFTLDAESYVPLRTSCTQQLGGSHRGTTRIGAVLCTQAPTAVQPLPAQGDRREHAAVGMARGRGCPLVCVAMHSHNSRTCRFSCKGFLCQEEEDAVYVLYTFAQSLDLLRIVSPRNRCDAACAAREALARTLSNHIGRMADTLRPDALGTWSAM